MAKAIIDGVRGATLRLQSAPVVGSFHVRGRHGELLDRDKENQHPISAIEGLQAALDEAGTPQEIPTQLPCPRSLTFTGAATAVYDGSEAVSVNIPKPVSGGDAGGFVELWPLQSTSEGLSPGGSITVPGLGSKVLLVALIENVSCPCLLENKAGAVSGSGTYLQAANGAASMRIITGTIAGDTFTFDKNVVFNLETDNKTNSTAKIVKLLG